MNGFEDLMFISLINVTACATCQCSSHFFWTFKQLFHLTCRARAQIQLLLLNLVPLQLPVLNKCDSSSRIIYFACLLTSFCWVVFLCQASPTSKNAKCHLSNNAPPFNGTSCTCLYSGLDPATAFPCTGGGGEASAHLGQGL